MKYADTRIERERCAYVATGNPIHAWAAYGFARQYRREIPEWVLQYFDKARHGLVFGIPKAIEERGTGKNLAPRIAKVLGFNTVGRGNPFDTAGRGNPFDYTPKWWAIGRHVRKEVETLGGGLDAARKSAEDRHGVNTSAVIRAEKLYNKAFPEGEAEPEWDDEDEMSMYAEWESHDEMNMYAEWEGEGLPPTLFDDDEK